jgi:uncharacterized membrane protein YgdD (TMEM256/DUF423 family)
MINTVSGPAKWFLVLGATLAALGVALGAAGSHVLKGSLEGQGLFEIGLLYHQYHALGLILVGLVTLRFPQSVWFRWSGWLMLAGIVLFSGNLYLRSVAGVHALHAVTPYGGAAYITAWALFALGVWRGAHGQNV